jgi:hypothetical protein
VGVVETVLVIGTVVVVEVVVGVLIMIRIRVGIVIGDILVRAVMLDRAAGIIDGEQQQFLLVG